MLQIWEQLLLGVPSRLPNSEDFSAPQMCSSDFSKSVLLYPDFPRFPDFCMPGLKTARNLQFYQNPPKNHVPLNTARKCLNKHPLTKIRVYLKRSRSLLQLCTVSENVLTFFQNFLDAKRKSFEHKISKSFKRFKT